MTSRFESDQNSPVRITTLHRGFQLFGEQMDLMGRESELNRIIEHLNEVKAAKKIGVIALIGPEGIGKTRLLFELADVAEQKDISVYRLRSAVLETDARSRLAAQVVRHRFGIPPFLHTTQLHKRLTENLKELIPDRSLGDAVRLFGHVLGLECNAESTDVEQLLTKRAHRSVISLIKRDARRHPVLVIADRIDEASTEDHAFLGQLLQNAQDSQILLALAMRDVTAVPSPFKSVATAFTLKPLNKTHSRDLATSLLSRMESPPKELMVAMAQKSRGIPGAMEQILRTLASRGIVDTSKRPWIFRKDRLRKSAIPESVVESAAARTGTLDDRSRGILQQASVVGSTFWFDAVLALMRVKREEDSAFWVDERSRHRLNRVLMDLQSLDIIHFETQSSVQDTVEFAFQNPHEAKLLYDELDEDTKALYHLLIAKWMNRTIGRVDDPLRWYVEIARHAKLAGEVSLATEALINAARESQKRTHNEKAIAFLRQAADGLRQFDGQLRYETHMLLGELCLQTGETTSAVESFNEALHASVVVDSMASGAEAYLCLSEALTARGSYGEATEMVRRSYSLFQTLGDQDGLARSLDGLGQAIWYRGETDSYREALKHFLRALALRRKLGESNTIASSLINLAMVHYGKGYALHSRKYFKEACDIYSDLDDNWGFLHGLIGMGCTWFETGDVKQALEIWGTAIAKAEEVGDRRSVCILLNNMGEAHHTINDQASAQVYLKEAQEIALDVGDMRVLVDALMTEAMGLLVRGETKKALRKAESALKEATKQNSLHHTALCRANHAHIVAQALKDETIEETSETHREISKAFNESIQELERMGNDLLLSRILEKYAQYLADQGVDRSRSVEARVEEIRTRLKEEPPETIR